MYLILLFRNGVEQDFPADCPDVDAQDHDPDEGQQPGIICTFQGVTNSRKVYATEREVQQDTGEGQASYLSEQCT